MKKITLGFSILAASAIFVTSCNKKVTEAPVADKEFQSSIDASFATNIMMDVDMICGFLGENAYPAFVAPVPGTPNTMTVTNSVIGTSTTTTIGFTNTACMDGKVRNGQIVMTYSFTDINSNYYRDYGFNGIIGLNNYTVDGWSVDDSVSLAVGESRIKNLAPSANPNPATTKLKWSIDGYFKIVNVADPTKRMSWVGTLNKTLQNTAQLMPNALTPITWTLAVIAYDGTFHGTTPGQVAYTYSVSADKPLIKDYKCSPDKALGITTPPVTTSVTPIISQFHPVIDGVASFTTGTLDPRLIDYGTSGAPCDNSGTITIKGISYEVDFKK